MDHGEGLTLEQQFRQRAFESMVERMSPEQAQEFLVKLHKHMLLQELTYKNLLRAQLAG
ncbi:MAG: hypothetical protein OHK0012_16270 [Synechococcales cyanobacterium]